MNRNEVDGNKSFDRQRTRGRKFLQYFGDQCVAKPVPISLLAQAIPSIEVQGRRKKSVAIQALLTGQLANRHFASATLTITLTRKDKPVGRARRRREARGMSREKRTERRVIKSIICGSAFEITASRSTSTMGMGSIFNRAFPSIAIVRRWAHCYKRLLVLVGPSVYVFWPRDTRRSEEGRAAGLAAVRKRSCSYFRGAYCLRSVP